MFCRDWKKLTFYYFADSYINFNSLVTDLFKIYKTRIWMSAINPASFVTPQSTGLQGPPTLNPLYTQDAHPDRRHQHDGRAYPGAREDVREGMANTVGMLRPSYADTYSAFAQPSRQADAATADPFGPHSPTSFGPLETGLSEYAVGAMGAAGATRMPPAQSEFFSRFQGLSLNS